MRHILCFGNPLHSDDGFGPAVASRLRTMALPPDMRVFDVGTRGLDALVLFEDCSQVMLVDACTSLGQPGRLHSSLPSAKPATAPISPIASGVTAWARETGPSLAGHGSGVEMLLRVVRCLGPMPELHFLLAEALVLQPFRPGLSETLREAVNTAAERLLQPWVLPEIRMH